MRTSISKKLLAGALSVMMVLSLVAPTGAQAASKYSVTGYKTVKAGKTYTYKIKGVKKSQYVKVQRNVTGETVKYNKKKLTAKTKVNGTGKNLTLKVKFSEKKENYTGKFTVRIYNAKSNKLVKRIVKSVKVKTQVKAAKAVESVALSNTTPHVGDTLTANVTPADATNVTYQWKVGGVEVEGATAATYVVKSEDLGKVISVTVKGENESTATSADSEAVAAKEGSLTATQTAGKKIVVTYGDALATGDTVTLTEGSSSVTMTYAASADGKTIEITTAANLKDATYTVTVTPADKGKAPVKADVVCETAKLTKIAFSKELILASNTNFYVAQATITGMDQFEQEFDLGSNLKVYPSIAVATDAELLDNRNKIGNDTFTTGYDSKTKTYTIIRGGSIPFQINDKVTMTAIYQNGTTTVQGQGELTVSNTSYVSKLTFAEFDNKCTKTTNLQGKRVTLDNFRKGTYYLKLTAAEDQYGNKLSAKKLNAAVKAKTLFVNPDANDGAYGGAGVADGLANDTHEYFDTLDDGTIVMVLDAKNTSIPGKGTITLAGIGGLSTTGTFTVEDNPYIDTMNVSVPSLTGSKTKALTVTATDQYGEPVDLYDLFTEVGFKGTDNQVETVAAANTHYDKISLGDKNGMSNTVSSLAVSSGKLSFTVNYGKKTVQFYYSPASTTQTANAVLTISTATPKVETKTLNIAADATISAFRSTLQSSKKSTGYVRNGEEYNFASNLYVVDSDGERAKTTTGWAIEQITTVPAGKTDADVITAAETSNTANDKYYWSLYQDANLMNTTRTGNLGDGATDGTAVESGKIYTANLYMWDASEKKVIKLDSKDYKIKTVELNKNGIYDRYEAEIDESEANLYNVVDGIWDDEATVVVYGFDGEGDSVELVGGSEFTASVNKGLVCTDDGVITADQNEVPQVVSKEVNKGTADVKVYAGGKEVAKTTINYSNETPVATAMAFTVTYGGYTYDFTANASVDVADGKSYKIVDGVLMFDGTHASLGAEGECEFYIADQYGMPMENTKFTMGGTQIKATTTFGVKQGANKFEATSGSVDGVCVAGYAHADAAVAVTVRTNVRSTAMANYEAGIAAYKAAVEDLDGTTEKYTTATDKKSALTGLADAVEANGEAKTDAENYADIGATDIKYTAAQRQIVSFTALADSACAATNAQTTLADALSNDGFSATADVKTLDGETHTGLSLIWGTTSNPEYNATHDGTYTVTATIENYTFKTGVEITGTITVTGNGN